MEMDQRAADVQAMFSSIAARYDLVNDLISLGQHRLWKAETVRRARPLSGDTALDLCTGTGDLALLLAETVGPSGQVIGVDFCDPMLDIARSRRASAAGQSIAPIQYLQGRAESIPLEDESVDTCTVAFGLRNVSDLPAALRETYRVLRPGGRLVSLDCSTPNSQLFGAVFSLYFNQLVPLIGAVVNRSRSAYTYLPNSVNTFPQKREMCNLMIQAGFDSVIFVPLSGGAVAIHVAEKLK
jgi:demethylmenaquinone methyltransferase / 2-methoxy-6-polyprenyl-1,4-benzoquinol methylase